MLWIQVGIAVSGSPMNGPSLESAFSGTAEYDEAVAAA
jgi:hypothetical protein